MDRGTDDVRGRLVGQLDHPLSQVCLSDLHPGTFETLVELDLFGRHRLALDHTFCVLVCTHRPDILPCVSSVVSDIDRPAVSFDRSPERVNQGRKALDRVLFDRSGLGSGRLVIVQLCRRFLPGTVEQAGVRGDCVPFRFQEFTNLGGRRLSRIATHVTPPPVENPTYRDHRP